MIEVQGVTVVFGRTRALADVSLSIAAGITGLFGPNGSGKSTLLRVLTGLLPPSSGKVLIEGHPLDLRDEDHRSAIGYAGHESGLYADLSVHENLRLFAGLYGVSEGRVLETLDDLQLVDSSDAKVGVLSAGTKRRVALARALVHRPKVLLLDEPYANLDDEAAELVSGAIRRWSEDGGTGVVASHGAKKVKAYASAGVVLQRGRVSTHGTYGNRFERA